MVLIRLIVRSIACLFLVGIPLSQPHNAGAQAIDTAVSHEWLEPKGLNIVDMVGQVPEAYLRDATIAFSGEGLVQYISGDRQGNRVTINARIYPKQLGDASFFNCLGQWAYRDQWPSMTPAAVMHLYENGVEITDQVAFVQYYAAGQNPPDNNTSETRYNRTPSERVSFAPDGGIDLRANMGCTLAIYGDHRQMTASFVVEHQSMVNIATVGQETINFHSYIGPGDAGRIDSLRSQMASRFGNRHDKFPLNPPAGAEYVLVNYPQAPVSPYPTGPVDGPSSGTYRLAHGLNVLSTDHTVTMGLPLYGQWRDADQSGGATHLPQIDGVDTLTAPEYFVPVGVTYDPCMSNGGCPSELLDRIYATEMALTVTYMRVELVAEGLDRVPLRSVGAGWSPSMARASAVKEAVEEREQPTLDGAISKVFMPFIVTNAEKPPENNDGCPCGWFDAKGAMLDFIAGP